MDGHERRFVRAQERDHGAGIQEPAARSHLYRVAGMRRSSRRYPPGFAASSLSGAAAWRTGGDLRRSDDLRENPERGDRLFWDETLRQFRPGVAASADRRADHQRPHGTVTGWTLSTGFSSAVAIAPRRFRPRNRAGVLGPIRAGHSAKPRALDVDVQALALPAGSGRSRRVSVLRERFPALRNSTEGKRGVLSQPLTKPARCGFHSATMRHLSRLLFCLGVAASPLFLTSCGTMTTSTTSSRNYKVVAYKPHDPSKVEVSLSLSTQNLYVTEGDRLLMAVQGNVGK